MFRFLVGQDLDLSIHVNKTSSHLVTQSLQCELPRYIINPAEIGVRIPREAEIEPLPGVLPCQKRGNWND
jgi:hypothetical protein